MLKCGLFVLLLLAFYSFATATPIDPTLLPRIKGGVKMVCLARLHSGALGDNSSTAQIESYCGCFAKAVTPKLVKEDMVKRGVRFADNDPRAVSSHKACVKMLSAK